MAISIRTQVFIGAFLLTTLISGAFGHSYVTSPQSRSNQKQTTTGCRGPNCLGPCDIPLSRRTSNSAIHSAKRGDSITIQWPRNNHAGGFIRFAWAPLSQSDNATYFDNHVQQINCHEVGGCHPDDASNPNGGDSGPADGSSRACTSVLTVPADLSDGQWTLQWAWFGGAFALGDYYSCVDYSIAGGNSGSTPVPVFVGGDYSFPGQQKCKFFNTDRLHQCVNEPCNNPVFASSQQQSGPPAYVQKNFAGGSSSTSTTGARSSTPPSNRATTAASVPSSSGSSKPSTTGARASPPSGSSSSSGSSVCSSGNMKCLSSNTFSTCDRSAWGPSQSCAPGTQCSPNGNYIYCLASSTPTSPPSTPSGSSGSCSDGYQRCTGGNSYQTCANGAWAATKRCKSGQSCHPSATANNIYCY